MLARVRTQVARGAGGRVHPVQARDDTYGTHAHPGLQALSDQRQRAYVHTLYYVCVTCV